MYSWWVPMPFQDMWIGLTEVHVFCLAMPLERFYYRSDYNCYFLHRQKHFSGNIEMRTENVIPLV